MERMTMNTQDSSRLAAINFGREIERLTKDFTGREWVFDEIDNWLKHEDKRFFILTGEPGVVAKRENTPASFPQLT